MVCCNDHVVNEVIDMYVEKNCSNNEGGGRAKIGLNWVADTNMLEGF